MSSSSLSEELMKMEWEHGAHNYQSLPVVIEPGERCYVYDVEGRRYFDCLSGYSAINQGHCHPRIVKTFVEQAQKVTLTSRAFYTDQFPKFAKYITELLGYDK